MKKRFWVMLVLSLLVIGLLSSCVSAPVVEENNDNTTNTETFDGGLVVNGDFSDSENVFKWGGHPVWFNGVSYKETNDRSWYWLQTGDFIDGELYVENGAAVVKVKAQADEDWKTQLYQFLPVDTNKTYTVTFKAKASIEGNMVVYFGADPWVEQWVLSEKTYDLTTEWQTFSEEVTIPDTYDPADTEKAFKIAFEFGKSPTGVYYIDDVSVKEKQ